MEKILEVSAKYSKKNAFWAKYDGEKLHLGHSAMDNWESVKVMAKYIHKKCILGKIEWRTIAFGVRYNGEKVRKV